MNDAHNMADLLTGAEAGATIVTGNRRAARGIRRAYDRRQLERGLQAWRSPDVLPFASLAQRLADELRLCGIALPVLLTERQEQALWADIIAKDLGSGSAYSLATVAMQAWQLLQAYEAQPTAAEMQATADSAAFWRWAERMKEMLRERNFITSSELPAAVAERIRGVEISRPCEVFAAGFDRITPQQQGFIAALEGCGTAWHWPEQSAMPAAAVAVEASDPVREIEAAARWARAKLDAGATSIGVIVPDLENCRTEVERVFRMVLDAEAMLPGRAPAHSPFHLSLGRPLAEWPMINTALLLLRWALEPLPIAEAGVLLRSPYIKGAAEERWARAMLDAELRRRGSIRVSVRDAAELASWNGRPYAAPLLARALRGKATAAEQPHSAEEWAEVFAEILARFGWPAGDLSSEEFQCHARWAELLSEFEGLDVVRGVFTFTEAVATLTRMAHEIVFAPEDSGAPVQVMGALEAAGSEFDALWMMRLDAERWPPPAHPSPLLPSSLQRRYAMAGCTPAEQAEFSERTIARLERSAREAVLSYPKAEGERELRPSPVMAGMQSRPPEEIAPAAATWYSQIEDASETFHDDEPVPFTQQEAIGGSALFRLQAACPFRAFSELRLHARELEEPEDGLDRLKRGTLVHSVMKHLWKELCTHERLMGLSEQEQAKLIANAVEAGLNENEKAFAPDVMGERLREVERERLQKLVGEWLEIEKEREPFAVIETEEKREHEVGGLRITLRSDRMDELADGRRIIVDYKTGSIAGKKWESDRPDDPQLPLYAVTMNGDGALAAVVFAHLKTGKLAFSGMQAEPGLVPKVALPPAGHGQQGMQEAIEYWRGVLTKLAGEFADGDSRVDPKRHDTCRTCALPGVCRIAELRSNSRENGDE